MPHAAGIEAVGQRDRSGRHVAAYVDRVNN
jgi:hypothetical protein